MNLGMFKKGKVCSILAPLIKAAKCFVVLWEKSSLIIVFSQGFFCRGIENQGRG